MVTFQGEAVVGTGWLRRHASLWQSARRVPRIDACLRLSAFAVQVLLRQETGSERWGLADVGSEQVGGLVEKREMCVKIRWGIAAKVLSMGVWCKKRMKRD